jgi:hypothetical protein
MNTRGVPADKSFIPRQSRELPAAERTRAEEIAFDKADEAASLVELKRAIELIEEELKGSDRDNDNRASRNTELTAQKERLVARVKTTEAALRDTDQTKNPSL